MDVHRPARDRQAGRHPGLHRPEEAGPDLPDPQSRIRQNGLMFGEGMLEILPDGFGFLRSPEYNYLPCPDDIYISPSRSAASACATATSCRARSARRRRTSATSRCCASRRSTARTPRRITDTGNFDDLTPLHPNRRLVLETDPEGSEHADRGPGHADRQGPAHADRRPAAHRQDGAAAEDRQLASSQEPPRGATHRPADRRAAGRSDRHGAQHQGRGRQLDLRRAAPAGTCRSPRW